HWRRFFMEIKMLSEDQISSVTLHFLAPTSIDCYRLYIEEHGGSIVRLAPTEEENYRIDFPPGTLRKPNKVIGPPSEESFDVLFPDGARLTWYTNIRLDDGKLYNIILTGTGSHASLAAGSD
ncbi:MAG TPA: hypothetical protein VFV38_41180, partial [Ktedonobacteraceae bacterium]|nr:hypothetical protein [Ktedonobacteraceae bacterium]